MKVGHYMQLGRQTMAWSYNENRGFKKHHDNRKKIRGGKVEIE